MSPRALVYPILAALLSLTPIAAAAQQFSAIRYSPQNADLSVNANSAVLVSCDALTQMGQAPSNGTLTVSAGTLTGGVTTLPVTFTLVSGSLYTASATWATPGPGPATVTCWVKTTFGPGATGTSNVTVAAPVATDPTISSFTAPTGTILTDSANQVAIVASDPQGRALTYQWTSSCGGTFADATAASTTWTAPSTQGACTLTATATNTASISVSQSSAMTLAISIYQAGIPVAMQAPQRVAATAEGDLLVVDGSGALFLLTKIGGKRASFAGLGATAVTVGDGVAYVATRSRGILKIDPATGRQVGAIPWQSSTRINGMAYDSSTKLLWVAAFDANAVIGLAADGSQSLVITKADTPQRLLRNMQDVAIDAKTGTLWIAERDGMNGNRVHVFKASDASYLRSMATMGTTTQVTQTGGLALDAGGRVFVSDAYVGTVQVMSSVGASLGTIGTMGDTPGYLLSPLGLAFMANGDVAVANSGQNRVDRFGSGAPLPTCSVTDKAGNVLADTDCDGLPDDWEKKYGLNPNDPSDALADLDGDGLNNREEFALGTDPSKVDTDGDGYSDRAELLAGYNPLDPNDHKPQLAVGGPYEVPPGLASVAATGSGSAACTAAWRQVAGAAVTLRNATTFNPSFLARKAGAYKFEGVATCGTAMSAPGVATVTVLNVPPLADAGGDVVTTLGRTVTLSGAFSSDANGEALTYAWEQVAGPPATLGARGSTLTVRPNAVGYHAFKLTVTDAGGLADSRTVSVVVVNDALPTAIVASPVVTATVGVPVTLDASASLPQGVTFSWVDLAGAVTLPAVAAPSFTPPSSGEYVFEVTAWNGALRSPPARVVVLAAAASLPTAVATGPTTGTVNAALTLDGSASTGSSLTYAWKQLAGPAAGLGGANLATATVVPFSTGSYAFELIVTDGSGAVSAPAVVKFSAVATGKVLPVAGATAPATAIVGELVLLDGRASTGATRYRWSQVAGPWVPLDGASAVTTFRPSVAGSYSFQLVVDDGTVRSAPVTVTVSVQ